MGNIKRLRRIVPYGDDRKAVVDELIMTPSKDKEGYLVTKLRKDGDRKTLKVHRVVAMAFIPNPAGYPEINHKNRIVNDNRVGNLEWCTTEYNQAYDGKLKRNGTKTRKIVRQYAKDGTFVKEWSSLTEIRDVAGYSMGAISLAIKEKRISHGYFWKFR